MSAGGDSPRIRPLDLATGLLAGSGNNAALRREVTEAFTALREPIFRYVFSVAANAADAEDITQEVFLRLFAERHRGKNIADVRAWVFRVAHNLVIDRFRSDGGTWVQLEHAPDPPAAVPNALENLIEGERRRKLRLTLSRLSMQERQCLELRIEGLRYREIAEVLGTRISSVQSYLVRAVQKVLKEFDD